jgi:uncharacterized protein
VEVVEMRLPESVAEFLAGKRFVVAGVSRDPKQVANAIYRKLQKSGYEVVPLNPHVQEVEGGRCYPNLAAVPGAIDGVVAVTHPRMSVEIVRQCADRGIRHIWFHRSFGQGSVSPEAIRECAARKIRCIVGGCPFMYCEPVDVAHRCMRWILSLQGRVPS